MKFFEYSIKFDGDEIGKMVTPFDDPRKAAEEWLERVPALISVPIRIKLEKEPGLLVAEREES